MAYMETSSAAFRPETANRLPDSEVADLGRLGRDEWSVVDFARNDGLWSLTPNGILARVARTLFGIQPPRPLANERLEALRRFAVIAWTKGKVGVAQARELAAAGFSCVDARLVLDYVARNRKTETWPRGLALRISAALIPRMA
jgi:hypothetical protein